MFTIFFGIYYIKEKCVVQANLNKYTNCVIIYVYNLNCFYQICLKRRIVMMLAFLALKVMFLAVVAFIKCFWIPLLVLLSIGTILGFLKVINK